MHHINHLMTTIPVSDLERASRFYSETLGLRKRSEISMEGGIVFSAGDCSDVLVYKTEAHSGDATVASFMVDDLKDEMRQLRDKGVKFEEYDQPGLKTDHGVAEEDGFRSAWFKDSEGNVLAVTEGSPLS